MQNFILAANDYPNVVLSFYPVFHRPHVQDIAVNRIVGRLRYHLEVGAINCFASMSGEKMMTMML